MFFKKTFYDLNTDYGGYLYLIFKGDQIMKKLNDSKNHRHFKSRKGLKLFSALGMALPVVAESSQTIFADGHHYLNLKKVPYSVVIQQNTFGNRAGEMAYVTTTSGFRDGQHHGIKGEVEGKEMRFYCLEPQKPTPGKGTVSKRKKQVANAQVKKVLMVGFGANSAADMGFPGKSSEAEYATQVAVWAAQGAINPRLTTWVNPTAHKIYNYIWKEVGKLKDSGSTSLTIKASKVDRKNGTATLTPELIENSEKIQRGGTVTFKGLTVTQGGKQLKSGGSVTANKAVQVKLNSHTETTTDTKPDASGTASGSTTGGTSGSSASTTVFNKGTITFKFTAKKLVAPMYNAEYGGQQDTVSLVAVPKADVKKSWSFESKSGKPVENKTPTPIKAMFDLKKHDDEADSVDQAKFDVYTADEGWSADKFIGTITTNKNGVARSGELDPGRYVAIERSTGKNLDIDQTPVHIDLTEENLKENAKVTHLKTPDGKPYDLYHWDVDGPINNHKPPKMTSLLTNLEDNSKYAQPIKGPVTLNEHLYFSHLVGTVTYNVHVWLVDKATGQPITINGQKIEASKTIGSRNNDNNDDGIEDQTDLQLKIPDASSLAGKDIVAYSEIARSDKPDHYTSVHQDINDKQETIHFSKPSIHTNAINKETEGKKLQPTDRETLTDTVTYKELIPGKEYTLKGIVMDKETGKAVLNNGKKVEFTKKFTADNANGRVDASVTFDAHHYRRHRLVVFESLYYTDYLLTDHRDINDVDQSLDVTNPQLHTTLSDNTQKLVSPKAENTVEDVIRYTDLIPGQTYSVRGKLIDQVTGSPVMKRGVPVMATATFKPNMPNGTVTLTFVFDGTQYTGHHLTAFESLYTNGRILVEHANLDDASQTVSVDNKHDNFIPIPQRPIIPVPTPGQGTVINNNNNNNNNNNSSNNNNGNNGNNSSNNGSNMSNNSGNNGNNGNNGNAGNNSGNNGNNGSNSGSNVTNNGANNHHAANNGSNNHHAANVAGNNHQASAVRPATHQAARTTLLPTAKMVAQPAQRVVNAQGKTTKQEALPKEAPATSEEELPQTGNSTDKVAQKLGAAAVVATVGAFVYSVRKKQTTGLE